MLGSLTASLILEDAEFLVTLMRKFAKQIYNRLNEIKNTLYLQCASSHKSERGQTFLSSISNSRPSSMRFLWKAFRRRSCRLVPSWYTRMKSIFLRLSWKNCVFSSNLVWQKMNKNLYTIANLFIYAVLKKYKNISQTKKCCVL